MEFEDADVIAYRGENYIYAFLDGERSLVISIHMNSLYESNIWHAVSDDNAIEQLLEILDDDDDAWNIDEGEAYFDECGWCWSPVKRGSLQELSSLAVCQRCVEIYGGRSEMPWESGV